ncbi:MAG TPA: CPBP family intramembrane glutamic endopeptidase [Friedmanniella sp.]
MWSPEFPPVEGRLEPQRPRPARSRPVLTRADPPDQPLAYHQLLRGPGWRWWRPLLSLAVLVGLLVVLFVVVFGGFAGLDAVVPDRWFGSLDDELSPISNLELDLVLAGLVPAAAGAVAIAHRVRPGWVSSVRGRLRWRWLGRCALVVAPVWIVYLGLGFLLDPVAPGRPAHWVLLLVMALVVTPFQAAGEEFLFRGWLVQNLGSCFARPVAGLVVSTVVSAALFGLAHGSLDPWVLLSIATLAVAACLANWRTGGLEAGIAMHAVNNVGVGVVTITYGGYADSFVSATTTGSPADFFPGLAVHALAVALILWQGRRVRIDRLTRPRPVEPGAHARIPLDPPDATWFAPLGR